MDLSLFAISENLSSEIRKNPAVEIDSGPIEFEFDANGNLSSLEKFAAR
jgi:hypothetical protein